MTYWSIHPQFDSDPRRNGKLRVLRHNTADGASQVIASNVKPDVAPLLAAAPDLLAALEELIESQRGDWPLRQAQAKRQARAAIAKAKGA